MGGTVGTPISSPVFTGAYEALPYTKMPLFDWAARLGLNPVHFAGGYIPGKYVDQGSCSSLWTRYTWQSHDLISHMDVARALVKAEELVEDYLGYHVSPSWRQDIYSYPRYKKLHRTNAVDRSGRRPAIQVQRGHIIDTGIRKQDYLGIESLVWLDIDADGWNEIAKVTVNTDIPAQELAIFPAGFGYHPSFEIRYPRHFDQGAGQVSFYIDFWHLIDPSVHAYTPDAFPEKIDFSQNGALITAVDIYHIYNDSTDTESVEYYWEPDIYAESQGEVTANGLGVVRDAQAGLIAPIFPSGLPCAGSPDRVKINYYSGVLSQDYLHGFTLNPLDRHLADAVFYLATARLTRDVCGCTNAYSLAKDLREDMALVSPEGNFLAVADAIQTSPFGTRRGEWLAYQEIKLASKHIEVALV